MKRASTFLSTLTALLIFTTAAFAQDAFLSNLELAKYVKTNQDYILSVKVKNNSSSAVTDLSVSWQLDGGSVHKYGPFGITGGLHNGGNYVPISLTPALNTSVAGSHKLKVWADATDETNRANDTITFPFSALTSYGNKVVLLEESTAQWCEHCPPAGNVSDQLSKQSWVAVSRFHDTDDYSFSQGESYYEKYYGTGNKFFPAAVVEMSEFGNYAVNTQYPSWSDDAAAQSGISPLALTTDYSLDKGTRTLSVTLHANFKLAEQGSYYFNGFILENGITNYQTQEDLSTKQNYIHNNVVRAILGGVNGTGGIIPYTPIENTDYSTTYTYNIPAGWNIDYLSFVGVVFNMVNGKTNAVNAVKAGAIYNDIYTVSNGGIHIFGAQNKVMVSFSDYKDAEVNVAVYDVVGKKLAEQEHVNTATNLYTLDMKNIATGYYMVQVTGANTSVTQKIFLGKE